MNNNKSAKIILYIVSIFIVLVSIFFIIPYISVKEEKGIEYIQDASIDYKVNLSENDFNIENTNKYIASLIDNIDLKFKYNTTLKEDINYKLKYKIDANVIIKEKDSNEKLYNYNENLLEEKVIDAKGNKETQIEETKIIDYNSFNEIAKSFNSEFDLTDVNSILEVKMYISFDGVDGIDENETVLTASMPLTTKTVNIDITDNTSSLSSEAVLSKTQQNNKILFVIIFSALCLLEIYLIYLLVTYILNNRNEKTIYYSQVNKIINGYDSYIQKVLEPISNMYKSENSIKVYTIESFTDMLEIRDNLNSPILMYQYTDKLQTDFGILDLQNKIIYIHTIKGE